MSLAQITSSEQDDRCKDLMEAFPSIGLLPTRPYDYLYRTIPTTSTIPTDPLRDLLNIISLDASPGQLLKWSATSAASSTAQLLKMFRLSSTASRG